MEQTARKEETIGGKGYAPVEDGIYFDLDEEVYHLDEALGSSDHRKLLENPSDWWYESALNPNRPENKDTPARLRGRAMHALVLEGEDAFGQRYMRVEHSEDMSPAEKSAATKAAKKQAELTGKTALPADVYDRVAIAGAMITRNPKLAGAFTNGMPEVSIFWTRDGIRRKARIDYLKPRGIGDLKSIANTREIGFPNACRNAIATYRYEMQAALYMEARSMIPQFYREGRVYGDDNFAHSILRRCAETKEFAFQWIFFQAEKAPITWSRILSPANPIFEIAKREIDRAADNYKAFMDKFGRDQMWLLLEEPEELDMNEMPAWWGRS
jgi:hypothetical protein